MKTKFQFLTFVAALGTLLAGAASGNTPLATLPLKASAQAQPNVIFGMDDSGSMDWEVLLRSQSGVVWWNGSSAWDSTSNAPLASSSLIPYVYLFPMGTATGGAIYPFDSLYGQTAPPIRQLAWLRSSKFNPLYYNTETTYKPWAQAYFDGNLRSFGPASPSAASAHPAVPGAATLPLGTDWTSMNVDFATDGRRFYVQQGMVLPVGTRVRSSSAGSTGAACTGASELTLTAEQAVGAGRACWASIPYFPATFWHPQACALGNDCVAQPNGVGTLKRFEIRTGAAFPSGRSAAAELQNFANWFSYYRKRKLMLAASMGEVLQGTSGVRLGVMPFNIPTAVSMFDAGAPAAADNRFAAAGAFYLNSMTPAGTPTHQAMINIGGQFEANTNVVQYACQRNNMFIVTDGFSNTATSWVPPYNSSLFGVGQPYAPTATGSLADLALAYYTNRLRATGPTQLPAGLVPTTGAGSPNPDLNTDLHINTYALTLGAQGTIWPRPPGSPGPFAVAPVWPTPVGDTPTMIDDLWHATLNGRGEMYLATNPAETAASIRSGLDDILDRPGTQGGLGVSTVNLSRSDDRAYAASYNPSGWTGDLEAFKLNPATGNIAAVRSWSASQELTARPWTTRVIATWGGTAGTPFSAANIGAQVNPGGAWGNTNQLVSYLRGDRSGEGSQYRARKSLLGAVINAEPVIDRSTGVAYLATGEGMLHAIDISSAAAGTELWAYVPGPQLADMGRISSPGYSFRTRLDGTPVVRMTDAGTRLLVAGMGAAGRGYYALDVTQPRGLTESALATKALWEFPLASDTTNSAKMGQTMGRPAIVRIAGGTTVVLVSSGYNNSFDGKGRLWMLNAKTGNVIREYVTTDGTLGAEAGLAQFSAFAEGNGTVRYVYGGDLLGNVWRFDLSLAATAPGAVTRLAQLRDAGGSIQPVTAAPELLSWKGQRIVFVGTGRLLDVSDFGSSGVQTMYALSDGPTIPKPRSDLVARTLNLSGGGTLTGANVDWTTQRGWYMDMPVGEQVNARPVLAYGALAWVGNKTGGRDCSASSRLYVVDGLKAEKFAGAAFVSTVLSSSSNSAGLTALLTSDGQRIRFSTRDFGTGRTASRDINAGVAIQPAKNSWREIRR